MNDQRPQSDYSGKSADKAAAIRAPERRCHPRYEFSVPVFVRVLVEEETFHPKHLPGHSRNISAGGMLIEITGLSKDLYKTLIRRQRLIRVHVQLPDRRNEMTFFGKIVWYDYRQTHRGSSCLCGIAFEMVSKHEREDLHSVLRELETQARP